MDIITVSFEESLLIHINHEWVKFTTFKSTEPGHVKLGIEAPKTVSVHREEVHNLLHPAQKNQDKD